MSDTTAHISFFFQRSNDVSDEGAAGFGGDGGGGAFSAIGGADGGYICLGRAEDECGARCGDVAAAAGTVAFGVRNDGATVTDGTSGGSKHGGAARTKYTSGDRSASASVRELRVDANEFKDHQIGLRSIEYCAKWIGHKEMWTVTKSAEDVWSAHLGYVVRCAPGPAWGTASALG